MSLAESPESHATTPWVRLTERIRLGSVGEALTWFAVGAGIALRIQQFVVKNELYKDERLLLGNLVGRPIFDLHTTLSDHQLAPPGFLVVERIMVRLPVNVMYSGRLIPLIFAIASLFLFRAVAQRYLDRAAVPVATILFAVADYLLYYSAEIKQYSCDLALTLAAVLLAAPLETERRSPFRLPALAVFGAVAVWFSHPVAFVLACVGIRLIGLPLLRRDWGQFRDALAICLIWAASFAVVFAISRNLLDRGPFMWTWWDFAFLPIPPRSLADASRVFWHFVNIFFNPCGVVLPLSPPYSALITFALFLVGGLAMGKRWLGALYLVASPIVLALGISALRKYPFHGRLIIYLVPSVMLLVAEGAAALGRRFGRFGIVAVALFVLYQPVTDAVWASVVSPRYRAFDSHGDLYPDLLDYFDEKEVRAKLQLRERKRASDGRFLDLPASSVPR